MRECEPSARCREELPCALKSEVWNASLRRRPVAAQIRISFNLVVSALSRFNVAIGD